MKKNFKIAFISLSIAMSSAFAQEAAKEAAKESAKDRALSAQSSPTISFEFQNMRPTIWNAENKGGTLYRHTDPKTGGITPILKLGNVYTPLLPRAFSPEAFRTMEKVRWNEGHASLMKLVAVSSIGIFLARGPAKIKIIQNVQSFATNDFTKKMVFSGMSLPVYFAVEPKSLNFWDKYLQAQAIDDFLSNQVEQYTMTSGEAYMRRILEGVGEPSALIDAHITEVTNKYSCQQANHSEKD